MTLSTYGFVCSVLCTLFRRVWKGAESMSGRRKFVPKRVQTRFLLQLLGGFLRAVRNRQSVRSATTPAASSRHGLASAPTSGSSPRLQHLRARLRHFRLLGGIAAAFIGMIALPGAIAVTLHRPLAVPSADAWLHTADAQVTLKVYETSSGRIVDMPLNTYLSDVLAAEFPPSASPATLQAGAVAARTYAIRAHADKPAQSSLAAQEGADVTDSSAWDLPFYTVAVQARKYPNIADAYMVRIQQAIEATDGLVLSNAGQPIFAFTFAMSPGRTRAAADVFGKSIPYLQPVACPDDAAVVQPQTRTLAGVDVLQALGLPARTSLAALQLGPRDAAGFITALTTPQRTFTGQEVSARLNLPSTHMTWRVVGNHIEITTIGVGTDLGMSLHEALILGAKGMAWTDILKRFYAGASLQLDAPWM